LLSFIPSLSGVNFGSAIGTTGTPPWTSFLLQPGIYSIKPSVFLFQVFQFFRLLRATLNGTIVDWDSFGGIFVGDRLISVSQTNTTLSFKVITGPSVMLGEDCALSITKVQ
jgi:hypothetical protein